MIKITRKKIIGLILFSPLFAMAQTPAIDLSLDKAVELALAENPTIRVADKEIEIKKVADKEAWQSLLPSVTADLALSHSIKVAAIKTAMGEFKMGMDGSTTATGGITMTLPLLSGASRSTPSLSMLTI